MRFLLPIAAAAVLGAALACDTTRLTSSAVPAVAVRGPQAGSTMPLIFVDGKRFTPGGNLDALRAMDIETIEVVKGAAAFKLFGDEGRNGVIRIYTKTARAGVR